MQIFLCHYIQSVRYNMVILFNTSSQFSADYGWAAKLTVHSAMYSAEDSRIPFKGC